MGFFLSFSPLLAVFSGLNCLIKHVYLFLRCLHPSFSPSTALTDDVMGKKKNLWIDKGWEEGRGWLWC